MIDDKPFSQACENNKNPILQAIRQVFNRPLTVWEIGSGTGQHACHFAGNLPHVIWQPTDRRQNLDGIGKWVQEAGLDNLMPPLELDVNAVIWPCRALDAVFTANTLHILSWEEVEILFNRLGEMFNDNALLCIYGPFNYDGGYTGEGNRRFDAWLKTQDPGYGIRDVADVVRTADVAGIRLSMDFAMPADNRLLVMKKVPGRVGQ
ncbi:MAG: DUF938 domain-containing protein [Gammaproteobacteria bacterium]